ncbi:MAG: hypothetical protein HC827_14855 [Cyanobacteria bacterium RM1_2_2]|nr:hypothetical protein [Cyanobacteria bacterium RM1_2_2]
MLPTDRYKATSWFESFLRNMQMWVRQEIVDDDPWDVETLFPNDDWSTETLFPSSSAPSFEPPND